jgi:CRP-like cAMP-binding protein
MDLMVETELLGSIAFFDSFNQEQLTRIQPYMSSLTVKPNDVVLNQGDFNLHLYFLIEGTVDILVDGNKVQTYKDGGIPFGEMSIAGHTTCTATVKAVTACSFVVMDWDDLQKNVTPEKEVIMKFIYKSCAEILAQKLVMTNALAKTFKRT